MAKTDIDRYNQTLQYITTISQTLAQKITNQVGAATQQYGQLISLGEGNASFFRGIVSNQHHAIRALVLCQNLFLPQACRDNDATVRHFKGKSEASVKEAILIYEPKPLVTLDEFRTVVENERMSAGVKNHQQLLWLTRRNMVFDGATNCYGAVNVWLVKAGLCSLDWYMNNPCNAYNVNQIIGNGQAWPLDRLGAITPGFVFNIHDANDQNICHWGVILETGGGGVKWAVASNTEGGASAGKDDIRLVRFRRPGMDTSAYGHFDLATSISVCEAKYTSNKVVLRVLDPTLNRNNYS